ncbi:geranylgeranylglyceryl/heptaprenylglyceryl phosphate synthase [Cryomorphaceae bacterium 1068]|nr:geranylgeranylglyceryl/heptaprenylglyceryl phosphate synthase [Cryomorphaceae bacterium 1068]
MMKILDSIIHAKAEGKKLLALLIDPDSIQNSDQVMDVVRKAENASIDFILFGGSLITKNEEFDSLKMIKEITTIPVILFPSSPAQIRTEADAILFLSLLSGRNSEYLIGHHVAAAPLLKNASLEILPTGYLLIGCGRPTTAEYVSGTQPIPYHKPGIAAATAMAGEMLGLKLMYLDGGSGADKAVSPKMISEVRKSIDLPLIVGGGIRSGAAAAKAFEAGADMIVVGNGAEENPHLIQELGLLKTQST